MKLSRILFTAGASGSGKTLLTCGILQALKARGLRVESFKCGPDYIDPMFHSKVIGAKSRNLDTFFTTPEMTRYLLLQGAAQTDIAVMEGVMGYYDGLGGISTKASAYEVATVTQTPVILLVNAKGMSVSILAYIKGFVQYQKESQIKGVILNQISPMLYKRMKKLVEEELGIPVYGYVPKVEDCVLESRHLGLVMPEEIPEFQKKLSKLAQILEETVELDALLELAETAPELEEGLPWTQDSDYAFHLSQPVRIAVARDDAFCFLYEDNLSLLKAMGAEIIEFSPLWDAQCPSDIDGLLLCGGYPELFAEQLEGNRTMRKSIQEQMIKGLPVMAECGGFMYLHEELEDMKGQMHQMVGTIKAKAYRTKKLSRFGYITLTQEAKECFGEELSEIPAHEFHYFDSTAAGEDFKANKPLSTRSWSCGYASRQMLAGFPHLYYYGAPQVPKAFLSASLAYQKQHRREKL